MISARTLEQNYQRGPSQLKGNYPELGHREANISLYIWILGEFWYGLLGRGCQTAIQVGLFLFIAGTGRAQTIDSIPTAYCTLSYGGLPSYNQLEGKVTAPNPGSKSMAQFVLEAFALANANNGLMDPQSQSAVVTALSLIQAMWVPALLNFKSYFADASVSDFNAVEFATESLVQIPYRFPHLLAMYGPVNQPGTIENLLAALLSEGQIGAINHHFTVGYTNQWMFRLCNLILTGQGVTDGSGNVLLAANADVLNRGRTDFMAWASNVREDGVREFMSPTYAGLDLEASGYLDLYARDTGISAMAQQAYKLFWIDLYANWYNRGQRMGGTHSRTYEFLVDQDRESDRFLNAVSHPVLPLSPGWPVLLNSRSYGYWRGQDFIAYVLPPPSDVPLLYGADLASGGSRTILRSFASDGNYDPDYMYGENYMANPTGAGGLSYPFSVGSAECFYNDLTFEGLTIMMPGDATTSNVNFNMQGRKDYYLQVVCSDGKADTLKPFIASSQNAAETLFLAASPGAADKAAVEVSSSIVIPNTAQVWIGTASTAVSLSPGQSVPLTAGSTLFIQTSNSGQTDCLVTGIRFLLSTDMNGSPLGLSLVNDGAAFNALRVTCIHSANPPTGGQAVMAVWTRTGYCSDTGTAFNLFRSAFTSAAVVNNYNPGSGDVFLSVPGLANVLTVSANVSAQSTTSLGGDDLDLSFTDPLLSVNGLEYVPSTLQDWASEDLGNATGGSAVERTSNGFYTGQVQVSGAGTDIWGTADGFQFYYQTLTGNGTVIGRVASLPSGSGISGSAKAGLMMRNDLSGSSANALIDLMGTSGTRFSVRTSAGAVSTRAGIAKIAAPYWFKLTRAGNVFTGYSSPDGAAWTQVSAPATIAMKNVIYVGMAVTSANPSSLIPAGFDNVGILQQ